MADVIYMQKEDANKNFVRFMINNYESWLSPPASPASPPKSPHSPPLTPSQLELEKRGIGETEKGKTKRFTDSPIHPFTDSGGLRGAVDLGGAGISADIPLMSHQLMGQKIFPLINNEVPVFFVLIDNLRYDQWKILEPVVSEYFIVEKEETYCPILPTTTAYARNAIFSGLLPLDISKRYPDLWLDDEDEGGKNLNEEEFLARQLKSTNMENIRFSYNKITNLNRGKALVASVNNLMTCPLNVIVFNFVDMLSHARTEMEMIRELAPDESAYRSITKSWFSHSPLLDVLKKISEKKAKLIITTDHGSIRVKKPFKIVGDRNTNTNLRYKQGKNLGYDPKNVLVAKNPERFYLPQSHVSTSYVFATEDQFFVYPNNYNYFVNYYKDTFQHGGISMEEMIVPLVFLTSR
ncbi:MAG: PglZ domain-containing protein [Cytophagales bacterium]|nr:PglZ domain-containing protein [Cytophagales bacterium]